MDRYSALLLTQSMQPHHVVPWYRSITLLYENKIHVLEEYDETVSSPTTTVRVPAVIVLRRRISRSKSAVKFSRRNVYARDDHTCQYCGAKLPPKKLNYDHVVPRHQGGKTVFENIVSACSGPDGCNARKRNRTPEQAGMRLLSRPAVPQSLPLTGPFLLPDEVPELWLPYLEGQRTVARSA